MQTLSPYLNEIPHRILNLFHHMPTAHTIPGNVTLPVDRMKIFVLADARYVVTGIARIATIEQNTTFGLVKFAGKCRMCW